MKKYSVFDFETPVRRQFGLPTRALLILPPAFLLSLKYDLPHILILTTLLVVFPIFQDRSFRLRDRPVVYSLLAAGILAVLPGIFVKIPDERLTFSDFLMRSHLFLPFLLYSTAISCWFMRTREVSALCLLIVLLSCLACGDVYNTANLENVSFAGTTPLLRDYRRTYLVCTVLQCVGTLLLLTADVRYDSEVSFRSVRLFRVLAVVLLIPVLWGAAKLFVLGHPIFPPAFQNSSQNMARVFAAESVIRSPMFGPDTPVRIVMKALAPSEPGYLRGQSYRTFRWAYGGTWFADEKNTEGLPDITPVEERNLTVLTFSLRDGGGSGTERMEFRFANDFRSSATPFPANAVTVTLDAKSAVVTRDGCLVAESWSPSAGVIAMVDSAVSDAAWQRPAASCMMPPSDDVSGDPDEETDGEQEPDPFVREDYLPPQPELPLTFEEQIRLRREIFGLADPMSLTPRQRIDAVTRFFLNNFTYSLSEDDFPARGRGATVNPVKYFLFERRRGHCELFATSAALLLRRYGVPTRYVTGIVCRRYNPAGYYYATNFDLHAWVEAWDDDAQRWTLVEATPPGDEFEFLLRENGSWSRGLLDRISLRIDNIVYWFRRGYPTQVVIRVWDEVYARTLDHVRSHPVRFLFELLVPLLLAVSPFLYFLSRRRRRYALTRRLRRLAATMRSLQLDVWRKTGVRREPWQTYGVWAKALDDPALTACVELYERIRYSGHDPSPEDVEAFGRAVREVRRHPPRRKKS